MSSSLSRRNFVAGAALGSAALATTASVALADAKADGDTAWDASYDVVVLGIGFAGMVAAMSAADAGATVLLAEKLSDGEAGGNSRVCGQMFFYGNGDVDATKAYLTDLCGSRTLPDDVLDLYAEGYANIADDVATYAALDKADFLDVATMGEALGKMSPEYPELNGSTTSQLWATHTGVSDSYLYQAVRANLEDNYADKVEVWFESPATKLVQDPETKAILGVEIDNAGAAKKVQAKGGVVLATGGFENDQEMCASYINLVNYACIGALGNTGDGLKMAEEVGAKLWHMTSWAGGFGLGGVSFNVPEDRNASMIATLSQNELNTGACILVGKSGKRWVNESETPRHGKVSNGNGQWLNPAFPDGIYGVYDKTQYDAAVEAKLIPDDFAGDFVECATVEDAAKEIGCDAAVLSETIDDFNSFVGGGKDYAFGRDPQYMRAFDGEAYYVVPFKPALLNTQGGPERDVNAQVLDLDDTPIKGLYSAGELGGMTSQMYAGGMNVGECFIMGKIAGASAAAAAK